MVLKIRLRQQGRKNRLVYRLVVSDARSPRDGKYVELLGWYQPCETAAKDVSVDADRVSYWLNHGAQLTDKAEALVARVAPEVVKSYKAKLEETRIKKCQKRRKTKETPAK